MTKNRLEIAYYIKYYQLLTFHVFNGHDFSKNKDRFEYCESRLLFSKYWQVEDRKSWADWFTCVRTCVSFFASGSQLLTKILSYSKLTAIILINCRRPPQSYLLSLSLIAEGHLHCKLYF